MPAVELNDGETTHDSLPSNDLEVSNSTPAAAEEPETDSKTETKTDEDGVAEKEEKEEKEEWLDVLGSGQLKMKVLKKGQPDTRPQPSDICFIKLKGVLDDGTVVEDHERLEMQLGCHEVVQGIELVVPLMDVEEEAVAVLAPRFAYGSAGNPPNISPESNITYYITLLSAEPEPELECIPFKKRKELASNKKERGNWWYSRQDSTKAIQCYRKAIDLLDETVAFCDEGGKNIDYTDEEMKEVIEQKLIIYNNLAAAQMLIEAYESALMYINRVLQCDPKNVKALFRKGKILKAKGQINEAVEVLRQAFSLEPENSAIKMELSRCVKVQQTEKQHEKNLYKKMLGQDKKGDGPSRTPKRRFNSWTRVLGTAATATIMAAVAIAVGYRFKNYSFL